MTTLVDNLGIVCLAIDSHTPDLMMGRTKLQKMIYFTKYLNWDIESYRLHFYGPYSNQVADSLVIAINDDFVNETIPSKGPHQYALTETGNSFLGGFSTDVADMKKVKKTRELFKKLAGYTRDQLELAATIDFVSSSTPTLNKRQLVEKISAIKENFSSEKIQDAYTVWQDIDKQIKALQDN